MAYLMQEVGADLVSISHYGIKPLKRIFTSSLTEALVNQLETPILTLNTRELHPSWKDKQVDFSLT